MGKTIVPVATYSCKKVVIALGPHIVTGYADDSFVNIVKQGDGVTSQVGCSGEIARSIDPNSQFKITLSLMQTSPSNAWLQKMYDYDNESCEGLFPALIKDLRGKTVFAADQAWAVKPTEYGYGKATANRSWEIDTGDGALTNE